MNKNVFFKLFFKFFFAQYMKKLYSVHRECKVEIKIMEILEEKKREKI